MREHSPWLTPDMQLNDIRIQPSCNKYLSAYPNALQDKVHRLIAQQQLGSYLDARYPNEQARGPVRPRALLYLLFGPEKRVSARRAGHRQGHLRK